MGKSAPKAPDPSSTIAAQMDANRVNQYTPTGNMLYGTIDANGNFVPNNKRESVMVTETPAQQQIRSQSDAAKSFMFGDIFGNYAPAANINNATNTANAVSNNNVNTNVTTNSNTPQISSAPASTQQPAAQQTAMGGNYEPTLYNRMYGKGQVDAATASRLYGEDYMKSPGAAFNGTPGYNKSNATTSNPISPNNSNQTAGTGSFTGGQKSVATMPWESLGQGLNAMGNPNINATVNGFGDPNITKNAVNYYDLNSIKGGLPGVSTDFSGDRQRTEDATYNRAVSRFAPTFAERNRQLEQRLADQGLPVGSEAYNAEKDRQQRMENEAYTNAAYDAVNAGNNAYQQMSDLNLRTRGQLFGEDTSLAGLNMAQRGQQTAENQNIFNNNNQIRNTQVAENQQLFNNNNQLNNQQFAQQLDRFNAGQNQNQQQFNQRAALLGIQPAQAQFTDPAGVDAAGIINNNYAAKLNAYSTQQGGINNLLGIGGQALGGWLAKGAVAASDMRLKENIKKIGVENGHNIYEFNYKGDSSKYRGVMAQEVTHIPGATIMTDDGYYMVNYKALNVEFARV